ncbi:MAG: DUF4240 domain-containing protein [Verrucomicrobiota bacterium]
MTKDEFWKILEDLPKGEGAENTLADCLRTLEPKDIIRFQTHFDEEHARAYRWLLWGAAYIIYGGCSDDGFIDFRYGLISRGRHIFETALSDPDSLVDIAISDNEEGCIPNESFGYVASKVYGEKTGNELPSSDVTEPSDPGGDEWDFDDESLCSQKLPNLWAKFK